MEVVVDTQPLCFRGLFGLNANSSYSLSSTFIVEEEGEEGWVRSKYAVVFRLKDGMDAM